MGNNDINKINQNFNELSTETKLKYAAEERHSAKLLAVFTSFVCFPMGIFMLFQKTQQGGPNVSSLICGIIIMLFAVVLIAIIIFDCQKSNDELALRRLKKLIKANANTINFSDTRKKSSFSVTKEIPILAKGWSSTKLLIDSQNKKFIYQQGKNFSKTYGFSEIINYEVYENGKSKVQGRAGSALIGGAFFGLGGLIVGSSMSRNVDEKCNQLKLFIRLNDIDCPQIAIVYVDNVEWDKSGWTYRNMKENLQSVCSVLEYMMNNRTLEQSETKESKSSNSKKEQLQELKEMLDDGLITREDYEQKKKQILGL